MTLQELKQLAADHSAKAIELRLPNGGMVPSSFHITELAHVRKSLVDCGGRMKVEEMCQLQAWRGSDDGHRVSGAKLGKILEKGSSLFFNDDLPVEIEYEDELISQYRVDNEEIIGSHLRLNLASKHTDCRARDVCSRDSKPTACCGGTCAAAA
jgi:Family of unknown function (DUF6428)